jgi:hypothetical protein
MMEELNTIDFEFYLHTIHTYIQLTLYLRKGCSNISDYSSETPMFYQNDLVMKNTADVTGLSVR